MFFTIPSRNFGSPINVASPILGASDSALTANPVSVQTDLAGNSFIAPQALNASTDWNSNLSVANNYGLGVNFLSSQVRQQQAVAQSAAPSKWWIWLFIALVLVVL